MKPRLILVLGDQLTPAVAALRAADPARDIVVMAEVMAEATHAPHHPQKIALFLSAMRHFADDLRRDGWRVAYARLDDPDNTQSIPGELIRRAARHGAAEVIATRPGDWRLIAALDACPVPVTQLADDRFLCSEAEFTAWAAGRSVLRMEYFYRQMRRKTGLMMEGDKPAGGQWNFDHDNRKRAAPDLLRAPPLRFAPDAVTEQVLALVEARFPGNFGRLRPFRWPVTREQALRALDHFAIHALPRFGDEQDAMLADDPVLSHSLLSSSLNLGLLGWREVCERVQAEWQAGRVPINAAEGYIRQIIGWREFIRGIWHREGPGYTARNALAATRALPAAYWGGDTRMACLRAAVAQTRDMAYAHHIQRLMVTGNFALLAGVDPAQVHDWYLSVYIDAVEWVEAPNTLGMSQFADGGVVASKPYAASGAYVDRMSDHCATCHYRVKDRTGPRACPLNPLYWDFLLRHRDRFAGNPRMAQMYRTWDRMDQGHRDTVLSDAAAILARLDAGGVV
ncbi:MAG: cryptochrome/photolyase family protein [Paracoccaceae bacterium]|nr:MAG: cryptochrome/photolyase family protein [Paracoccaceae bacterium]